MPLIRVRREEEEKGIKALATVFDPILMILSIELNNTDQYIRMSTDD